MWVVDLGEASPRDIYVAWADFAFIPEAPLGIDQDAYATLPHGPTPVAPLAQLAYHVLRGAVLLSNPRAPSLGGVQPLQLALEVRSTLRAAGEPLSVKRAAERQAGFAAFGRSWSVSIGGSDSGSGSSGRGARRALY